MVVDCGGGTVDVTTRELLEDNKFSEKTVHGEDYCGSSFVDQEFLSYIGKITGPFAIELMKEHHYAQLQYIVQEFCRLAKFKFTGEETGFEPYGIINLIKGQLGQIENDCSAMFLVGGFSESKYLQARIKKTGLGYHKLLNVIGAMDGVHIPIHQPSKMVHAISIAKVFILSTFSELLIIRDVLPIYMLEKQARSVHDARVFYRSSLYHEISLHSEQWVPGETYIIADAAYPLRTYLIKAFPNYYMGTNRERHFNKILSSMRMVIERAFGHLKER
ncbi:5292_t:CDS:2 [Funneliformis geosporum]|uniref:5292_t:CDS:1 n=1 Tax=Funneliformis geosporum TaxID=1117311 RepID=A0A9W4SN62_9GLOM|nr:5292_t:CDS:2 [Funneliformis geosporum]